tara:strand:- start:243 stop:476 length:234 start_codon:yes stop_codon:yes gene_type:complete
MIDAVITDLELEIEQPHSIYGHFVSFTFIDTTPSFPKVNDMLKQVIERDDVSLVNYNWTTRPITKDTDLSYYEIVKH